MRALQFRKVEDKIAERFIEAARVRGRTHGQHLESLVKLHERVRVVLDDPHAHPRGLDEIRKIVDELGLGSVTR